MDSKLLEHHEPEPVVSLPPPSLLQLPIELVLVICDHLDTDPASHCSLAITCRSLFSIIIRDGRLPRLDKRNRNSFLCLLERDLDDRFYLCCRCLILRRFNRSWGPTSPDSYRNCERQNDTARREGPYRLGYHHVRLVMHHHRSGGTKGIPLENLNQSVLVGVAQGPSQLLWRQYWSARIIENELFVSAHHTLQLEASGEAQARRALDGCLSTICRHTSWLALPQGSLEAFWLSGSCDKCLTDWIMSIERSQGSAEKWHVSITAYHQVGDGTSPWDWKWRAYTESRFTRFGQDRDPEKYPPGLIRETWNSAQSSSDALSNPKFSAY